MKFPDSFKIDPTRIDDDVTKAAIIFNQFQITVDQAREEYTEAEGNLEAAIQRNSASYKAFQEDTDDLGGFGYRQLVSDEQIKRLQEIRDFRRTNLECFKKVLQFIVDTFINKAYDKKS